MSISKEEFDDFKDGVEWLTDTRLIASETFSGKNLLVMRKLDKMFNFLFNATVMSFTLLFGSFALNPFPPSVQMICFGMGMGGTTLSLLGLGAVTLLYKKKTNVLLGSDPYQRFGFDPVVSGANDNVRPASEQEINNWSEDVQNKIQSSVLSKDDKEKCQVYCSYFFEQFKAENLPVGWWNEAVNTWFLPIIEEWNNKAMDNLVNNTSAVVTVEKVDILNTFMEPRKSKKINLSWDD